MNKNIFNKKWISLIVILTLLLPVLILLREKDLGLIPQPKQLKIKRGSFTFDKTTKIFYDKNIAKDTAALSVVQNFASTFFTEPIAIHEKKDSLAPKELKNSIFFQQQEISKPVADFVKNESYQLQVKKNGMVISANKAHGFFNAMQTVKQLCNSAVYSYKMSDRPNTYKIPNVIIEDEPSLKWRGYMIDVARHFRSKKYILKTIRGIAINKINVLHMHLSDDQGYRLESTLYPKITAISTRGNYTIPPEKRSSSPQEYYTKKDVKEILSYARKHFIKVVPEIDIPGHSAAILKAYPEYIFKTSQGEERKNVFDIGSSKAVKFLKNLLSEVSEMFENPEYFHIGADEVNWLGGKVTLEEHAKVSVVDQTKFCREISDYLYTKHKTKTIIWNSNTKPHSEEIFSHGRGVVQYWDSKKDKAKTYVSMKHPMINSWTRYYYLDMKQFKGDFGFQWGIKRKIVKGKKKLFYPNPKYIYKNASVYAMKGAKIPKDRLLGIEGPMWSETITSEDRAEQKTFPRIAVISELAWATPKEDGGKFVSWRLYKKRLLKNNKRYKAMGIGNFFKMR